MTALSTGWQHPTVVVQVGGTKRGARECEKGGQKDVLSRVRSVITCEEKSFHQPVLCRWRRRREEDFNLHKHVSTKSSFWRRTGERNRPGEGEKEVWEERRRSGRREGDQEGEKEIRKDRRRSGRREEIRKERRRSRRGEGGLEGEKEMREGSRPETWILIWTWHKNQRRI